MLLVRTLLTTLKTEDMQLKHLQVSNTALQGMLSSHFGMRCIGNSKVAYKFFQTLQPPLLSKFTFYVSKKQT